MSLGGVNLTVHPTGQLVGEPELPGDKSISHRALLLGGLAEGVSEIKGLSTGLDVQSTRRCLSALGVEFAESGNALRIFGRGKRGFASPRGDLDCGNSGTTMRLLTGLLAGARIPARLVGDASLSARPMARVAEPLRKMGARIHLRHERTAPIEIEPCAGTQGFAHELLIASAQIKSALILAGLQANGETLITGRIDSRDHTERMLPAFGAKLHVSSQAIQISGGQCLRAAQVTVPRDPSAAAFWIVAAALLPAARITLTGISLNATRMGLMDVMRRMGAEITCEMTVAEPEPMGNITVQHRSLRGVVIEPHEVPSLLDELPLVAVLAAYAEGVTEVRGAEELRVKETDRIEAIAHNLRGLGVKIETFADGFAVSGGAGLKGGQVDSFHDHRIAMAFAIGALAAHGPIEILNIECASISDPGFFRSLARLRALGERGAK